VAELFCHEKDSLALTASGEKSSGNFYTDATELSVHVDTQYIWSAWIEVLGEGCHSTWDMEAYFGCFEIEILAASMLQTK
jgi:hypothetical protein